MAFQLFLLQYWGTAQLTVVTHIASCCPFAHTPARFWPSDCHHSSAEVYDTTASGHMSVQKRSATPVAELATDTAHFDPSSALDGGSAGKGNWRKTLENIGAGATAGATVEAGVYFQ